MSLSKRKCLATARLTKVWASRYAALKRCILRESAIIGRQVPLMPQSPRAMVGTAIHEIFKRASTDPGFKISEPSLSREWERAIRECEEFLSASEYMEGLLPLTRSIPNLGLMRSRTILRIMENGRPQPREALPSQSQKNPEGKFASASGSVVGVPDRIDGKTEFATIIDYKTGLTSDAAYTQDNALQLKLYAALFHEATAFWPKQLELHGLDGSVHVVPFSPEECSRLLSDAEKLVSFVSEATANLSENPSEQSRAATPSAIACRFCAFRPACPAYLSISFISAPPLEADVAGILRGWKTLGNGELLVELECRTGTARVRNLPPIAHILKALQSSALGQKMIVFNIVKNEEDGPLYSPTGFTALHAYREGEV